MSRYERIMSGAAIWAGYYRFNISRFAEEYLHVRLRLFQKILLVMMNLSTTFLYIASRGQGKSYLCAIFCCCRAILYPGSKIVIASGTRGQAINILEKITMELKPRSKELAAEIDEKNSKINGTNAVLAFKNTSYIKVVTSGESARGQRAHVLILDEFRLINKDTIDTILQHFLASKREPEYSELTEEEKKIEMDKECLRMMYLSSAYFQEHWSYGTCVDAFKFMLRDNSTHFICGLPYQLAIKEGLLGRDRVEEQMAASDFTEPKWAMEMGAVFWGAGDGSFFDYSTISKSRHIKYPILPSRLSSKLIDNKSVRIPPKQNGEKRILSADIALMSSKKNNNDATAIFINQMMPTKAGRYISNIVYCDSYEGLRTDQQALIIRKLYDEYQCDYIVIDTNGVGLGCYDALAHDISDPETGEIYPALSCMNDKTMADRCTVPGADKVIWSIKANATLNSDCAFLLREGFRSGRIRLLVTEYDGKDNLSELKGYNNLSEQEQLALRLPYVHTTLLIDELVKLQHDESGGKVKIRERSGARKDRYSSLSYNYYVATQLESRFSKRNNQASSESFIIKAPKTTRKAVSGNRGRRNTPGWF